MTELHNPQFIGPHLHDLEAATNGGVRLLTVEEHASMSDVPPDQDAQAAIRLFAHLKPEYYHEGKCAWVPVKFLPLSNALTYRTRAPLTEEPPEIFSEEFHRAGADFAESLAWLSQAHHEMMKEKGFWRERYGIELACAKEGLGGAAIAQTDLAAIALIHTELSEMAEAIRQGSPSDDKIPAFSGPEAEAADVLLRLMDLAFARGWRIGPALIAKMRMNATRGHLHGKLC